MKPYPSNIDPNAKDCANALNIISRLRDQDVTDRNTFPAVFVSGRTVGKIPTSSADIAATDRVGDISFAPDGSFVYYCVDVSGAAAWRRIALSTW